MRIDDVVKMIRGKKGTVVSLRVRRRTGTRRRSRSRATSSSIEDVVRARRGAAEEGRADVRLHPPAELLRRRRQPAHARARTSHKLLVEMKAQKVAGVVLDLRSNGGGLLGDAVELTGELIDQGPGRPGARQPRQARRARRRRRGDGLRRPGDRARRSVQRIGVGDPRRRAAGLSPRGDRRHGRRRTARAPSRRSRISIGRRRQARSSASLKLTIQQFFRVSGDSTQREGVMPDILLPNPNGYIETGERTLEHALPCVADRSGAARRLARATGRSPTLAQKSAARVAKEPVLVEDRERDRRAEGAQGRHAGPAAA